MLEYRPLTNENTTQQPDHRQPLKTKMGKDRWRLNAANTQKFVIDILFAFESYDLLRII